MRIGSCHTLTQPIQERARSSPEHPVLVYLNEDQSELRITAAEFHHQSARYAVALQAAGVREDDLVILVLRHELDLLYAFWGAMYLGAIGSIFPFLTEKLDPQIYMARVRELVKLSQARAVITSPEFKAELASLFADAGCAVLSTDEVIRKADGDFEERVWPDFSGDKTAFLQHSSGTTGLQKGVALSHIAVLNQIESYSKAIDLKHDDVVVSWLPLYHDMGLIAGFLMPLVAGIPLVLMSPFKWVRDPKVLFQVIQREKGTLCWMPNFAYNHSARVIRPRDLSGIDLSSMRAFINCSEPVYLHSHQVFVEKFSAFGVNQTALSTCYAMAENTFAVTQYPVGKSVRVDWVRTSILQKEQKAVPGPADEEGSTALVSCGFPISGTEIRILNSDGKLLKERRVGEIALRSNCMLSGYYRRPEVTQETIQDGWYHTGDMGYLADGELFITGRKKDLIIVGGKNIYPQDLEAIANEIPGIIPGRSAAFGLFDQKLGSENIVMVCELEDGRLSRSDRKKLDVELRRRVVQQSDVALSDIWFVERSWLIKTSSGKISRSANREKYLRECIFEDGTLQAGDPPQFRGE